MSQYESDRLYLCTLIVERLMRLAFRTSRVNINYSPYLDEENTLPSPCILPEKRKAFCSNHFCKCKLNLMCLSHCPQMTSHSIFPRSADVSGMASVSVQLPKYATSPVKSKTETWPRSGSRQVINTVLNALCIAQLIREQRQEVHYTTRIQVSARLLGSDNDLKVLNQ